MEEEEEDEEGDAESDHEMNEPEPEVKEEDNQKCEGTEVVAMANDLFSMFKKFS